MQKPRKVNNYVLSILFTLVGSIGLALVIIALHVLDLGDLSDGLLELVCGIELFMLVSQMMSGNGYFFQFIDKIVKEKTLFHKARFIFRKSEFKSNNHKISNTLHKDPIFIGLTVGTVTAIGLSILELLLHMTPFAGLGKVFSSLILFVSNLSLCNGLGNRIGRIVLHYENNNAAWSVDEKYYTRSLSAGLIIGIVASIAIIAICGVSVISGGAPLGVALFCLGMIGGSASAAGYIGRVFDFILGAGPLKVRANKENVLTTLGIATGLAIGISLVVLGGITLPFFGAGLPSVIAGIALVVNLIAAGGGAGNRIGAALDAVLAKRNEPMQQNFTINNKQCCEQKKSGITAKKQPAQILYNLFFKPNQHTKIVSIEQSNNMAKHGLFRVKATTEQPKALEFNNRFKPCVII